jgi:hypothetical protein
MAAKNPKLLPSIGQRWRTSSGEVELIENGKPNRYVLKTMPLPGEDGATMQRFEAHS